MTLEELDCEYRDTLLGHPGMRLVPAAWSELLESGFMDTFTIPIHSDYPVIVCSFKGYPVGLIAYQILDHGQTAWINLSYVDHHFRNMGVYRMMFDKLSDYVRGKGCVRILSGVWATNGVMNAACEALGRQKNVVLWEVEIKHGPVPA
jgi:GNAT superfamily N-acetyltransferase